MYMYSSGQKNVAVCTAICPISTSIERLPHGSISLERMRTFRSVCVSIVHWLPGVHVHVLAGVHCLSSGTCTYWSEIVAMHIRILIIYSSCFVSPLRCPPGAAMYSSSTWFPFMSLHSSLWAGSQTGTLILFQRSGRHWRSFYIYTH